MKPKISGAFFESLRKSEHTAPWRCKIRLPPNRTIYACEIDADGEIAHIGGRAIYSESDLGFRSSSIEEVTIY